VTEETRGLGRLLLAPAVALLFVWMIVPLGMTIYFSSLHYNLLNPGMEAFVGLENYYYFLTDPAFLASLQNTLVLVVGAPDHQYRVPDLRAGPHPIRRRNGVGGRPGGGRARQHRRLFPCPHRRPQFGGLRHGEKGVHGAELADYARCLERRSRDFLSDPVDGAREL
jgi:hypothetical protein